MDEKKGDPKRVSLYFDFRKKATKYDLLPRNFVFAI